jgi:hypothetical protein
MACLRFSHWSLAVMGALALTACSPEARDGDGARAGDEAPPEDVAATASALSAGAGHHGPARGRAPRLIAPLSTTHVPVKQPLLKWRLPAGAHHARVELCADRACASLLQAFETAGESATPPAPLPDGPVFWRVTAVASGRCVSRPSATWEMWPTGMNFPQPGLEGPPADAPWGSVLDVNGDGLADLAVGAPGETAGFVHVFFGNSVSLGPQPSQTLAGATHGAGGAALFGITLATAGDVNGDGFADLAVATGLAPSTTGTVQVFYGGPDGLRTPGTTLGRGSANTNFGSTLATAGDFDGDGYADLLVSGVPRAQVYRGGPRGIDRRPALDLRGADIDPTESPQGAFVVGGGDVNGDRFPDVMVEGFVYLGTGSGFALQADLPVFDGLSAVSRFLGDVNGDGRTDVWTEILGSSPILPGSPTGVSLTPFREADARKFPAGLGDSNRDGFTEVAVRDVSIPSDRNNWSISYGSPLGCNSPESCDFLPHNPLAFPQTGLPFGNVIAAAGDLNGDRLEDVAMGNAYERTVYIFLAPTFQGQGVPVGPTLILTNTDEGFGATVE